MRGWMVAASALLLAGCGGEKYAMPASQAYQSLAAGSPTGFYPLPAGLFDVNSRFEAIPAASQVQWLFRGEGGELGRLVATVAADGDSASTVSLEFVEGDAPDNPRNAALRRHLNDGVYKLAAEAIDAKLDKRAFDTALREQINMELTVKSAGSMMNEANRRMDEEIGKSREREKERELRAADSAARAAAANATKPATDLSKF